jgi:hypothetical protein
LIVSKLNCIVYPTEYPERYAYISLISDILKPVSWVQQQWRRIKDRKQSITNEAASANIIRTAAKLSSNVKAKVKAATTVDDILSPEVSDLRLR